MKHPVTGLPFDYEHVCDTCIHFTDKTRSINKVKFRTIRCALDSEQRNLDNIKGTTWRSVPACSQHRHVAQDD